MIIKSLGGLYQATTSPILLGPDLAGLGFSKKQKDLVIFFENPRIFRGFLCQ